MPSLSIYGVLTLMYCRGKHVSANHEEGKVAEIPDHIIIQRVVSLAVIDHL